MAIGNPMAIGNLTAMWLPMAMGRPMGMGCPMAMWRPWPLIHCTPLESRAPPKRFFDTIAENLLHLSKKVVETARGLLPHQSRNVSAPSDKRLGAIQRSFCRLPWDHLGIIPMLFFPHHPWVILACFWGHFCFVVSDAVPDIILLNVVVARKKINVCGSPTCLELTKQCLDIENLSKPQIE